MTDNTMQYKGYYGTTQYHVIKDIEDPSIVVFVDDAEYTGKHVMPSARVYDTGKGLLKENRDYVISYANNVKKSN